MTSPPDPINVESTSQFALPLSEGQFDPNNWIPILIGEEAADVYPGYRKLQIAGIEAIAYGNMGYAVIVSAANFNRSREMLLADAGVRPFVITEVQFADWLKSHPDANNKLR